MPSVLLTASQRRDLRLRSRAAISRSALANAAASVDDENDRVGLGDRLLRLARHLEEDAPAAPGSSPPCRWR